MEFNKKIEPLRKLNTKGCCFICLQSENINQSEELDGSQVLQCISIRHLLRHLQIPTAQSLNDRSIFGEDFKKEDIQVVLCENCGHTIRRFSVLFQKLEKIQLEMDYFLERIHRCISQSSKAPELVQNYSKRMTSDLEALSQLAFVDNLRKQVAKESLKKMNVPRLQLILTRADIKLIKTEINHETFESNGGDVEENYFSDDISPPSSPNSTGNREEDFNKLTSSPSFSAKTSKQKEKPASTLKQPVIQKSKYHTKDFSTGMYECKKCDKKSKFRKTIAAHFNSVHLKLRYKCDICNISEFTKLMSLKLHKETCREKLPQVLERKSFQFVCKECGQKYRTKHNLSTHRSAVHRSTDRYPCDLCDKKFKRCDHLKNHRDAVHFGKRHCCGICSKSFACKGKMRRHERKCTQKLSLKEETQQKIVKSE